jgi:hypothetical protein
MVVDSRYAKLFMQPHSTRLSHDHLAPEAKGIYGGLALVEAKCMLYGLLLNASSPCECVTWIPLTFCPDLDSSSSKTSADLSLHDLGIDIDAAQAADPDSKLGPEQWQALITLHRTLLCEHYDFFVATQYPLPTDMISGLAQKYDMPARMWRHGIHGFLVSFVKQKT